MEEDWLLWMFPLDLNPAIGNFAGDARHQERRRIRILQALDNEADSVKLAIPKMSVVAGGESCYGSIRFGNKKPPRTQSGGVCIVAD